MAEKRKKRAKRLPPKPIEDLPPAKLDSQQRPVVPATTTSTTDAVAEASGEAQTPATATATAVQEKGTSPQTKAQKLLESQRESVAMLTAVREAVEQQLSRDDIRAQLDEQGYWYGDDFLASSRFVDAMATEGVALLQHNMSQGVLGSGEFVESLLGGEAQYQMSPRSIEWVVSLTKHAPAQFAAMSLSAAHCMATMRTFDRNVLEASLRLLLTSPSSDEPGDDDKDVAAAIANLPKRPWGKVVTDPASDRRRLSLYYYLVPEAWDADCGGGLTFLDNNMNSSEDHETTVKTTVAAKRNRLVIFKSDETSIRSEPWRGNSELQHGSCIELHLIQADEPQQQQ